jgi:hypothetical protein
MFTGFASENTPAIQIWDYFSTFAGTSSIALADDCAPIQYFRTGSNTTSINLYLPSSPIEGKQIKIINSSYGSNAQSLSIYVSDRNGSGASFPTMTLGPGQTIDLCYSKNCISFGTSAGFIATGWISLNQASVGSAIANSVVSGGTLSTISGGTNSFIGGGSTNKVTTLSAGILAGSQNTAGGGESAIVGGTTNNTSGLRAIIVGGNSNNVSGSSASILGSSVSTANGDNSAIIGGAYGITRSIQGNAVSPASSNPITTTQGVSQSGLLVLARQTTDATATVLRSNTSAASTTNQVILPNNSAYVFQGTCIANVTGGSTTSGWKYEGVIKRGANAASTTLVAAVTPTVIAQDALASTWVLAITADTTNGGIAVTVTGAAATTIRWVSKIETTEVTF